MRFALSDDQAALRDAVRDLLQRECTPAVLRARDALAVCKKLAEVGVPGAALPEELGGLDLGACDLVPLLEEAGRVALPLPIVETAFVAAPLLGDDLAERLAAGDLLVACALDGSELVPYAGVAHVLLVADHPGGEIRLLEASGATQPADSIDGLRALGRLADGAAGSPLDLDEEDCALAWQRGALGCAAQLIGLSRTLLELTTGYVKDRRQFGVPVGSFQAVKHHLANALMALEFAAPAVRRAAWSLDQMAVSTGRDVAMAKALASEAAQHVAGVALQCHGAIAYTTEYDLHLFAKRVWASARSWGDADWQRERVGAALGLGEEALR